MSCESVTHTSIRTAYLLVLAAACLLSVPEPSRAAGRAECKTVASKILGRAVRYCALLPASFDSSPARRYPIVYHLHGMGDNEQTLLRLGGWDLIERLAKQGKLGEFVVATPAAGSTWYINAKDGRERYEDFFLQEFMPAMEQRYRAAGTRAARGITGVSMGGYGALRFAFKYPQKFAAVSAHSAALMERMQASASQAFGRGFRAFGEPFDTAYWNENTPFAVLRAGARLAGLKIYFDCGSEDDYGFHEGARALNKLLSERKVTHEFHLYPGGHDAVYVAEHIDESFQFQSRALGAR